MEKVEGNKMEKKIFVISLGGSMIIPEEVNLKYLLGFKKLIKHIDGRFIVVCGGGSVARKYITALMRSGKKSHLQGLIGIAVTRLNAIFMTYFFGQDANEDIPMDMNQVKSLLRKNKVVFCGALRYAKNETSDATAAKLAHHLHADFVNITNVQGLYDKNPMKHQDARLIRDISWDDFLKKARRLKYKPGQHFVLDQTAARLIQVHKTRTFIVGPDLRNLERLLKRKGFVGTRIRDYDS